jgi:hypothetical protein
MSAINPSVFDIVAFFLMGLLVVAMAAIVMIAVVRASGLLKRKKWLLATIIYFVPMLAILYLMGVCMPFDFAERGVLYELITSPDVWGGLVATLMGYLIMLCSEVPSETAS